MSAEVFQRLCLRFKPQGDSSIFPRLQRGLICAFRLRLRIVIVLAILNATANNLKEVVGTARAKLDQ